MAMVSLPQPRSSMSDTPNGLQIVIPGPRNLLISLFIAGWLVGWWFGEMHAIEQIRSGQAALFIVGWLLAWTVGGAWVVTWLLWTIGGREVLILGTGRLSIRREVFGIGFSREYDLSQVRDLRIAPPRARARGNGDMNQGGLCFDYGAKTIRFGSGVDEAEARQLIQAMQSRIPSLQASSSLIGGLS